MESAPSRNFGLDSTLWAIDRSALEQMVAARETLRSLAPGRTYGRTPRSVAVTAGGVGVLSISGVLERNSNINNALDLVDETTYQEIAAALQAAVADPGVKAIALKVDSPGGAAVGISLAAEAIAAAARQKHVVAYTEGMMASAAYYLASQADQVFASAESLVGSIGTVIAMYDISGLLAKWGIKLDLFASGPHKGAGTPGSSLTEAQRVEIQGLVEQFAGQFVQAVARGRNRSPAAVQEWATGQVWLGSKAAEMGLIDGVTSFAQLVALLEQTPPKNTGAIMSQVIGAVAASAASAGNPPPPPAAASVEISNERQRTAAISAAFADDPAFALRAIAEGWGVIEAKEHYVDVLRSRMAERTAVPQTAAAAVPDAGQSAVPPAAARGVRPLGGHGVSPAAAGADASDGSEFDALVRQMMADNKCSRLEAVALAARKNPAAHRDYVVSTNSGKARRLAAERFEEAGV